MQWVPLCILKVRHPSHSQHERLLHHCHNANTSGLAAASTGILEDQAGTAGSSVSLRPKTDVILLLHHHHHHSCCGWRFGVGSAVLGISPNAYTNVGCWEGV